MPIVNLFIFTFILPAEVYQRRKSLEIEFAATYAKPQKATDCRSERTLRISKVNNHIHKQNVILCCSIDEHLSVNCCKLVLKKTLQYRCNCHMCIAKNY